MGQVMAGVIYGGEGEQNLVGMESEKIQIVK